MLSASGVVYTRALIECSWMDIAVETHASQQICVLFGPSTSPRIRGRPDHSPSLPNLHKLHPCQTLVLACRTSPPARPPPLLAALLHRPPARYPRRPQRATRSSSSRCSSALQPSCMKQLQLNVGCKMALSSGASWCFTSQRTTAPCVPPCSTTGSCWTGWR
jgi:hypothetical protein